MTKFVFRFVLGGAIVSLFAVVGDVFKPKSFAGLFGAAPSVALSTLGLTLITDGRIYTGEEAGSMVAGAMAFLFYAIATLQLIVRGKLRATSASISAIAVWLICAIGAWLWILR